MHLSSGISICEGPGSHQFLWHLHGAQCAGSRPISESSPLHQRQKVYRICKCSSSPYRYLHCESTTSDDPLSSVEQKERTEALVINPLTQLLLMFAGPHKLIQKRFDKLLDYDNCKERADRFKDRRTQEELQVTRNTYEALNAQLLDELPKFHGVAEELFTGCVRAFAQAQKDFMKTTLGELKPLLQVVSVCLWQCGRSINLTFS